MLFCQILSVQQLYRICTLYWDDNYNTRSVSPDVSLIWYSLQQVLSVRFLSYDAHEVVISMQVISSMKILMTEDSNNADGSSFLLDDNSRWKSLLLFIQNLKFK